MFDDLICAGSHKVQCISYIPIAYATYIIYCILYILYIFIYCFSSRVASISKGFAVQRTCFFLSGSSHQTFLRGFFDSLVGLEHLQHISTQKAFGFNDFHEDWASPGSTAVAEGSRNAFIHNIIWFCVQSNHQVTQTTLPTTKQMTPDQIHGSNPRLKSGPVPVPIRPFRSHLASVSHRSGLNVPDGFVCPVGCDAGRVPVGEIRCEDRADAEWTDPTNGSKNGEATRSVCSRFLVQQFFTQH